MKKWISYIILCIIIPALVTAGTFIFKDKQYAWVSLCTVILSCVPFFMRFEKREKNIKRMILIAIMIALSSIGRILFSLIMDVWTVLWSDGYFNFSRYLAATISAVPFTVIYAVSNVIFLLLFSKPIGKILDRIKVIYDL